MSLLGTFEQNVKLKQWLTFVGVALALVSFYFLPAHTILQHLAKSVGVVGGLVSVTGQLYDIIYP